jgi:hypothetical protein
MKIHLVWIRVTAAAAIVAGATAPPAAAQYAPYRPAPPQPAAQPAVAPATPYMAHRAPVAYQQPVYPQPVYPYGQQPTSRYQAPVAPVAPYQAPAAAYRQPVAPYPQTAMAHYPGSYGATPYVAQTQPTEVMPAPQQTNGTAPVATGETMPATTTTMPADPVAGGYANGHVNGAGCNGGGYYGGHGSAGCYPGVAECMDDCGSHNIWFGGIYYLFMDRADDKFVRLAVEVDHAVAPDPYYPPKSVTVVSTSDVDYDWRSGAEVRFGCTFDVGHQCDSCNTCGSGYGYPACGCNSCAPCSPPPTTFAWEVAWWGLDNDPQAYIFEDQINTRVYGMKNFAGLEYDRDAGATWAYRPVNEYYDYQIPIPAPPGAPPAGYIAVLAQRVWSDFKVQNLEVNMIRFPICDPCGHGGCGYGGCNTCGYDACGCSNYAGCNSCGCEEECWTSNFSAYGSCGVRYFRTDDDFAYDTEFAEYDGVGTYDQVAYNGFTYDNSNELCYDVQVENNLIGPQVGWTTNYCVACKWNFFCNSTFGVFENHMTNYQRMWSGGDGTIRFAGTGETFNVRSSKDDIAFLGELRIGGSYDFTCHWRGVLAYRAVALSGVATSFDQIPDQFSSVDDVEEINSDNSIVIHGVQTGVECRY